ncbi:Vacuolar iron transporter1 [Abeliophyllum distichum]|uniref:Vacuolar iron transporter1 n=1 Tax=Abeliophyllum distichum TaxID=126358 RepID=A0ABD1SFI8_9LAMI
MSPKKLLRRFRPMGLIYYIFFPRAVNVYPVECHTPHPLNNMAVGASSEIKISIENEEEKKMIELIERGQWLRAAILGANDGLLSTTSLMLGVSAAKEDKWLMIISGLAGAVAGACSMAVGEFVSVSTQRDIELQVNILKSTSPMAETKPAQDNLTVASSMASTSSGIPRVKILGDSEPTQHKISPGTPVRPLSQTMSPLRSPLMKVIARDTLIPATPLDVAKQENKRAEALPNPYKAAGASGLAFLFGSLVPLLSAMAVAQNNLRVVAIVVASSIALAIFGGAGAHLGGVPVRVSALRVVVGGWISMAVTYGLLKPLDRDHDGNDIHK